MSDSGETLPLQGLLVVELGVAYSLPGAAMLLAGLGAEVVKIEPLEGENVRSGVMSGGTMKFGTEPEGVSNSTWLSFNRGKRSLPLDLKTEDGLAVFKKLIRAADVFMHNIRPGVPERLGIGYEDLKAINPSLVYCELFGYGDRGPLRRMPGSDIWVQALTGLANQQSQHGDVPRLSGTLVSDHASLPMATVAVLAGLMQRHITGRGTRVSTTLMATGLWQQVAETATLLVEGRPPMRSGRGHLNSFPYAAYQTKNRALATLSGFDDQWRLFCEVLGISELATDPRYDTQEKRVARRSELYPILDRAFSQRTAEEWDAAFRAAKLICVPCLTQEEFFAHPHAIANEVIEEFDDPDRGRIRGLAFPIRIEGKTPKLGTAPRLGADTRAIMERLGYTDEEIDRLIEQKAVGSV